jgi:acetyl/propionyl-CoA carboxylase alpha subunit
MTSREVHWKIADQEVHCRIEESLGKGTLRFADTAVPFQLLDSTHIEISGKRHRFYVIPTREGVTVWLDGRTYHLQRAGQTPSIESAASPSTGEIRALMPGKLIRLDVAVGDTVTERQPVGIMESMKMESTLVAPKAGRVSEIRFKPGDVLEINDVVMVIG